VPDGPIETKWERAKFDMKLVNPANKRRFTVTMVGSGLAGASAAASLAELGYDVDCFCFQDSPRRAHSIAAQGGINAAKNYQNDGDSVFRLFYDTVKGGDFRAREANVYRLAQVSVNIIDQCVAQGVLHREYGGLPATGRSESPGTHLTRARANRPAVAARRASPGEKVAKEADVPRRDDGIDRRDGPFVVRATSGRIEALATRSFCTGGYGNVFYLSTNAKGSTPPSGARTARGRPSPTPATRRSTPRASRSTATTSPSSPSCPSRSATTAGSGCR
jgi:succinate dehydrogenase / fumarate reductase flavoprotein subunit